MMVSSGGKLSRQRRNMVTSGRPIVLCIVRIRVLDAGVAIWEGCRCGSLSVMEEGPHVLDLQGVDFSVSACST